jgi:hypothetical protein
VIDLKKQFPDGLPPVEEQDAFLQDACKQSVDQYLRDPEALRNKTLTLFWDNPHPESWDVGSTKVNCSIGKELTDEKPEPSAEPSSAADPSAAETTTAEADSTEEEPKEPPKVIGFASITGSATGEILINGEKPVPPLPIGEGRRTPEPLPGYDPPS